MWKKTLQYLGGLMLERKIFLYSVLFFLTTKASPLMISITLPVNSLSLAEISGPELVKSFHSLKRFSFADACKKSIISLSWLWVERHQILGCIIKLSRITDFGKLVCFHDILLGKIKITWAWRYFSGPPTNGETQPSDQSTTLARPSVNNFSAMLPFGCNTEPIWFEVESILKKLLAK